MAIQDCSVFPVKSPAWAKPSPVSLCRRETLTIVAVVTSLLTLPLSLSTHTRTHTHTHSHTLTLTLTLTDLNHSSSTCTTSEGECKETPNDPTIPEELDSPLDQSSNQPNQTEPEMEESPPDKEPPIKQKRPVKGPFATELTTMNIHIVLPGVQHPIDAVVSGAVLS